MMISRLLVLLLLIGGSVLASAQTTPPPKVEVDDDDVMPMSMDFKENRPFFEPIGGMATWSYKESTNFENSITYGGILGFRATKEVKSTNIMRDEHNSLYLQFHNAGDLTGSTNTLSSFRFGFSSGESYGYRFSNEGKSGVYFGHSKAPLSWFTVNVDGVPAGAENAALTQSLRYFEGELRFGEASTALIGFRVAEPVTLNVGYEWAQIYERHMFWYWAMSQVMEGAADGLSSWFVRAVGVNSPAALPIMHFILRNGVAMGFKALRMEQMNWPFTTEAPINIMTLRLGASINF